MKLGIRSRILNLRDDYRSVGSLQPGTTVLSFFESPDHDILSGPTTVQLAIALEGRWPDGAEVVIKIGDTVRVICDLRKSIWNDLRIVSPKALEALEVSIQSPA